MVTECRAAEQSRGVTPMAFWSSFVNAWITPTCAGSSLLWNLCLRFDNGKTVCVNVSSYAFEIKSADIVPLNSYRHLSFKKKSYRHWLTARVCEFPQTPGSNERITVVQNSERQKKLRDKKKNRKLNLPGAH